MEKQFIKNKIVPRGTERILNMTPEEFETLVAETLENVADVGTVSKNLDAMRSAFGTVTADLTKVKAENEDLTAKNASLKENNLALFLKVGEKPKEEKQEEEKEEEEKEIEIDELFDKNGGLI